MSKFVVAYTSDNCMEIVFVEASSPEKALLKQFGEEAFSEIEDEAKEDLDTLLEELFNQDIVAGVADVP